MSRYSDETTASVATEAPKEEDSNSSFHFLRFYSQKANIAIKVISTIGASVKDGHPFVTCKVPTGEVDADGKPIREDEVIDVKDCPFVVLQEFQYWVAKPSEAPYEPIGAWTKRQDFKATYDGVKVKGAYMAEMLILTPNGPIVTYAEVVGTKTKFMEASVKALSESKSKDFQKAHPDLRKVPARFRQVGRFNIIGKTSPKFGAWSYADALFSPASADQAGEIEAFLNDGANTATLDAMDEFFDSKVKKVQELADETGSVD